LAEVPKPAQPAAPAPIIAAAPPASEPRSETFAEKTAAVNGLRQNFSNNVISAQEFGQRAAKNLAKDERNAAPLDAFELRQDGNRVKIIDADGSISGGEIGANSKRDRGGPLDARAGAGASAPPAAAKPASPKPKSPAAATEFS